MMRIQCLFMLLTVLVTATGGAETQNKAVQLPSGKLVVLDGQIFEEEWRGAYKQQLTGGGELRLQQDGSNLYVGVKGVKVAEHSLVSRPEESRKAGPSGCLSVGS